MFAKPQKFKCNKCGHTKMGILGCDATPEICSKCGGIMTPCDTNWFDKLLGRKNFSDTINDK